MIIPDVIPWISPIFIQLNQYISDHGPNVDFKFTLEDIHDLLQKSGRHKNGKELTYSKEFFQKAIKDLPFKDRGAWRRLSY